MFSLRVIVFAVIAAVSFIPVFFFGIWPYSKALDNALEEVSERHLLLARNQGSAMARYHDDLVSTFTFLSRNASAGRETIENDALLRSLNIRHICVFNEDGGTLATGLQTGSFDCPDRIPADRRKWLSGIARPDEVVLSGVAPAPDGSPSIFMVLKLEGLIVVGNVSTDYFTALARSISFGQNGHSAIVDQHGRVLAHPMESWEQARKDISMVPAVQEMMAGRTGVTQFFSPAFNGDMVAGYTAVEQAGWGVMVPQPLAELESKAASVRQYSLWIIGIGVLLALIASWFLALLVTAPLNKLAHAIKEMQQGHSREPLALDGPFTSRELLALEKAFNEMVAAVRQNNDTQQELRLKAENADQLKSLFLANMSHEIRTPLNAIIGFSEVIKDQTFGPVDPRYQDYSTDIHDSGQMMLKLINDILDLSKIEAGQADVEIEDVQVSACVDRCRNLLRHMAEAGEVTVQVDPIPDELVLSTDASRFCQILLNLMSNAIKFTPKGGEIRVACQSSPEGRLELLVSDTGIGIDNSELEAVFLPFGQAKIRSGKYPGTGLGLPLAVALCRLLGGSLSLESQLGKGTEASISLPGLKTASRAA